MSGGSSMLKAWLMPLGSSMLRARLMPLSSYMLRALLITLGCLNVYAEPCSLYQFRLSHVLKVQHFQAILEFERLQGRMYAVDLSASME